MEQRETILIEVKETGADQATSKIDRLNASISKSSPALKGLNIDLSGVTANLQKLGQGGEATIGAIHGLTTSATSAASAFVQTAIGAGAVVTGAKAMAPAVKQAADEVSLAQAALSAFNKEQEKMDAATPLWKKYRDSIAEVPRATGEAAKAREAERKLMEAERAGTGYKAGDDKKLLTNVASAEQALQAATLRKTAEEALAAETAVSSLSRVGAVGLISLGAAAVAVYASLQAIGSAARSAADDNGELADKLGITTAQLGAISLVANENSGSVEGLQRVYDKLSKSLNKMDEDNAKTIYAFETLGLAQSDLANLTEQQVAGRIIKAYDMLDRSTKATTAVQQLLGPAFRDQIPSIRAAAEEMGNYQARVDKFGSTASEKLVEEGGKQERALSDLALAWKGFANQVGEFMGGAVTSTANGMAAMLKSMKDTLLEANNNAADYEQRMKYRNAIPIERRKEIVAQVEDEQKRRFVDKGPEARSARIRQLYEEEAKATIQLSEARTVFRRMEVADADSLAKAALKKKSDAATPPPKAAEKRDPFLQALEDAQREVDVRKEASALQKTQFETEQGKYKEFSKDQKDKLLQLAKEADAKTILEKKADIALKQMEEYGRAEEQANEQLKQRLTTEDALVTTSNKRLKDAGNSSLLSASMQRGATGQSSINTRADEEIVRVIQEAQAAIEQLTPYLADYEKRVEGIRKAEMSATEAIREAARQREEYNADWTNGAKSAFATYLDDVTNVAGKTQELFGKAFSHAEDAMMEFVTTGKLNFKSFIASILSDIARYLIQTAIMAPIIASLKAMMGFSSGGVFDAGAVVKSANGNVYSGGSLQKFAAGTVVSQPTLFPTTTGMGLMGEAGPEAIMPLARNAQGQLGVKTSGATSNSYAVTVQIGSVDSAERALEISEAMKAAVISITKQTMSNEMRKGNMLNR
jgi:lambda family phage tail tape measure protein